MSEYIVDLEGVVLVRVKTRDKSPRRGLYISLHAYTPVPCFLCCFVVGLVGSTGGNYFRCGIAWVML